LNLINANKDVTKVGTDEKTHTFRLYIEPKSHACGNGEKCLEAWFIEWNPNPANLCQVYHVQWKGKDLDNPANITPEQLANPGVNEIFQVASWIAISK
jgi:hypothetical protein